MAESSDTHRPDVKALCEEAVREQLGSGFNRTDEIERIANAVLDAIPPRSAKLSDGTWGTVYDEARLTVRPWPTPEED